MDFRSICSKIDVDSIRAKIPPLPDMVTQIKLPKSMSKLKSRKVFRSSRDDLNTSPHAKRSSSRRSESSDIAGQAFAIPLAPPSDFVDHTPRKISTISSLVGQSPVRGQTNRGGGGVGGRSYRPTTLKGPHFDDDDDEFSYRSAGGIEDYCPSPLNGPRKKSTISRTSLDMSPSHLQATDGPPAKKSLMQRAKQGYKEASEFRLKHIFVKKTVVRQDTIQVDNYVHRYEEDRQRQQMFEARRNSGISDDYEFEFKLSSRKSEESFGDGSPEGSSSHQWKSHNKKTLSEQSGDESGMEQSPPKRKPGIAATRFSRVRKDPLHMSLEEDDGIQQHLKAAKRPQHVDDDDDAEMQEIPLHPIESALKKKLSQKQEHLSPPQKMTKSKSIKKGLGELKNESQEESLSLDEKEDGDDEEEDEDFQAAEQELEMETVIAKRPKTRPLPPRPPTQKSQSIKNPPLANLRNVSQEESLSMDDDNVDGSPEEQTKTASRSSKILSPIQSSLYRLKGTLSKNNSADDSLSSGSTKKRKAPLRGQKSQESLKSPGGSEKASSEKASSKGNFKENLKRFHKSIKLPSRSSVSAAESDVENQSDKVKQSKSQQFAERLKRFRSVDNVDKHTEEGQEERQTPGSPLQKLSSKLQDWKKSFKIKASEKASHTEDDDEMSGATSPKRKKGTLIKRLQQIRMRKQHSQDDPDDDEEGGATYRESFRSRAKLQWEKGVVAATQMPQMTMEKLKESKKYFRKRQEKEKEKDKEDDKNKKEKPEIGVANNASGESDLEDSEEETAAAARRTKKPAAKALAKAQDNSRHYYSSDDEEPEEEEDLTKVTLEPYQPNVLVPLSRAAWSAKPIHPDSTGDEDDDMLPRVLIHQDNSDVFESTLIIAVTRPIPSRSSTSSPYITELPPDYQESPKGSPTDSPKPSTPETKADNWIPNREIISAFNAASSSSRKCRAIKRDLSKDSLDSTSPQRAYSRNQSMDSSSDESSWLRGVNREPSTAIGLIGNRHIDLEEEEGPWKVGAAADNTKDSLYKTKSIDIFELHKQQGQALHIFEDFDDELKNTPVVKIEREAKEQQTNNNNSAEDEEQEDDSSDDEYDNAADDDNSSRITKILRSEENDNKIKEAEASVTPPLAPKSSLDNLVLHISEDEDLADLPTIAIDLAENLLENCRGIAASREVNNKQPAKVETKAEAKEMGEIPKHNQDPNGNKPSGNTFQITKPLVQPLLATNQVPLVEEAVANLQQRLGEIPRDQLTIECNLATQLHGSSRECLLQEEIKPLPTIIAAAKPKLANFQYANSQESLMGNVDPNETPDDEEDSSYKEDDQDSDEIEDMDRPPSSAPSPPPVQSPPPPPLPQRQTSPKVYKAQQQAAPPPPTAPQKERTPSPPPPLPQTKPPLPPNRPIAGPPKIPERTPSVSKVAKPLVKTASLRLAYSEQVKPQDVGKVNKLISRFEPQGRPRIIPKRNYMTQESEEIFSDDEEETIKRLEKLEIKDVNKNIINENEPLLQPLNIIPDEDVMPVRQTFSRDRTPTNANISLETTIATKTEETSFNSNNNNLQTSRKSSKKLNRAPPPLITTSQPQPEPSSSPTNLLLTPTPGSTTNSFNQFDRNSNYSQSNSEYGSPMDFPSSLMGSTEVTPISMRKETEFLNTHRSRRSMTRDDAERYYSFDSDEENSYYSISSTGSSRYVVEL
uniref:Uncharacterized protein n=1 Tax=Stomoxys calcitrans TaxID=35570 RepID=A0A1I8QEI2_STOCA